MSKALEALRESLKGFEVWRVTVIFGLGKAVLLLSSMEFLFLRISEKANVRQEAKKEVKGSLAYVSSL